MQSPETVGNQLITTDWISLQPRLKKLNIEHNRISDLSGLTKNNLFRQLDFLGLDKNPLSKQTFEENLPILIEAIKTVNKPQSFQPLSPCYLSPASGSRLTGKEVELHWFADSSQQQSVYDLYLYQGDSLVPIRKGIETYRDGDPLAQQSDFWWFGMPPISGNSILTIR